MKKMNPALMNPFWSVYMVSEGSMGETVRARDAPMDDVGDHQHVQGDEGRGPPAAGSSTCEWRRPEPGDLRGRGAGPSAGASRPGFHSHSSWARGPRGPGNAYRRSGWRAGGEYRPGRGRVARPSAPGLAFEPFPRYPHAFWSRCALTHPKTLIGRAGVRRPCPTNPGQNKRRRAVMGVTSPGGRLRKGLSVLVICLLTFSVPAQVLAADSEGDTGTLEKLIVASGQRHARARSAAARPGRLRRHPDERRGLALRRWSGTRS